MPEFELNQLEKVSNVDFLDSTFFNVIDNQKHEMHEEVKNYLKILSLCHTVIVEDKDGVKKYNVIHIFYPHYNTLNSSYQAASPDELALLNFAKFCGFKYLG